MIPAQLRQQDPIVPGQESALTHGLSVVTRNRKDFAKAGVQILAPFTG